MFVDKVKVTVEAGKGGDGIVNFRHEIYVDKGGPDGGDGGDGGDVILVASRNQNTLAAFRYNKLLKAPNGMPGDSSRKHGRSAKNMLVPVPVGTIAMLDDGQVIADLTEDNQQVVIARGGRGGFGNAHFVSSVRQAPKVAEKAKPAGEPKSAAQPAPYSGAPAAARGLRLAAFSCARCELLQRADSRVARSPAVRSVLLQRCQIA